MPAFISPSMSFKMNRILIGELSEEQKAHHCNGCGAKGGTWKPPQWHSRETCNQHDIDYWVGGTEDDRIQADRELLTGMLRDAGTRPWWQQPWYRVQAWIYYRAVRKYGAQYFSYGTKRTLAQMT